MRASGREFSNEDIIQIQRKIDNEPNISRRALSQQICEELDWRSARGKLKEMSCRVALVKLERAGKVRLNQVAAFPARRKAGTARRAVEAEPIRCGLDKLQPIELTEVRDRRQSQI